MFKYISRVFICFVIRIINYEAFAKKSVKQRFRTEKSHKAVEEAELELGLLIFPMAILVGILLQPPSKFSDRNVFSDDFGWSP